MSRGTNDTHGRCGVCTGISGFAYALPGSLRRTVFGRRFPHTGISHVVVDRGCRDPAAVVEAILRFFVTGTISGMRVRHQRFSGKTHNGGVRPRQGVKRHINGQPIRVDFAVRDAPGSHAVSRPDPSAVRDGQDRFRRDCDAAAQNRHTPTGTSSPLLWSSRIPGDP